MTVETVNKKLFHIGKNGPGSCGARKRCCPLGGDHYETLKEATKAYEEVLDSRYNPLSSLNKSTDYNLMTTEELKKRHLNTIKEYKNELKSPMAKDSTIKFDLLSQINQIGEVIESRKNGYLAENNPNFKSVKSSISYGDDKIDRMKEIRSTENYKDLYKNEAHYSTNVGKVNPNKPEDNEYFGGNGSIVILADSEGKRVRAIHSSGDTYKDPSKELGRRSYQVKQYAINRDVITRDLVIAGYISSDGSRYGYIPNKSISAFVYK